MFEILNIIHFHLYQSHLHEWLLVLQMTSNVNKITWPLVTEAASSVTLPLSDEHSDADSDQTVDMENNVKEHVEVKETSVDEDVDEDAASDKTEDYEPETVSINNKKN